MIRSMLRPLAVAGTVLALAQCSGDTNPTQPDREPGASTVAPSFALAANSWTPKAATFTDETELDAVEVTIAPGHSLVYAIGGHADEATGVPIEAYDLATNTWTRKQSISDLYGTNGTGKIGTLVYFSGGFTISSEVFSSSRVFAYNPITDVLTRKADMPLHTGYGVSGAINGKLYVLPGVCGGEGYPDPTYCAVELIRTLYRYDPGTNTWATRRPCPHFHRRAGAGVINGKFYVVGGESDKGHSAVLDVYDPVTNTWTTRAPIPTAGVAAATVVQNKLFVVTSTLSNNRVVFKAYAYDPVTNTWKARAAPPTWGALARIQLDGHSHVLSVNGGGSFGGTPPPSQLYTP
jgi:N-acetylneuraminic acid mutarotase